MLKCADGDRKSTGRCCGASWTASSCRRDADVTVLMQTQGQIVWLSAFRTSQTRLCCSTESSSQPSEAQNVVYSWGSVSSFMQGLANKKQSENTVKWCNAWLQLAFGHQQRRTEFPNQHIWRNKSKRKTLYSGVNPVGSLHYKRQQSIIDTDLDSNLDQRHFS